MRSPRVIATKFVLAVALVWSSSPLVGTSAASSALQGRPATASNGTMHLVVWDEAEFGEPRDLRGVRRDGSGNAIGTAFDIAASPAWDMLPQVAWDGENFIVAWYRTSAQNVDLLVARVSPAGSVLDPSGVVVAPNIRGSSSPAALASGGVSSLVAWFDSAGAVRSSRISRAGVVLDPGGDLVGSNPIPAYTGSVSAAWHESRYLVVWDVGRPPVDYAIFANRIDGDTGSALDGPGVPVAAGPGPRLFSRVAGGPGGFLVVWTDGRASPHVLQPYINSRCCPTPADYDLYGARVSDAGIVVDPGGFVIAPGQGAQVDASLTQVGDGWLLALVDNAHRWSGRGRVATTWVSSLPSLAPAATVDVSSSPSQTEPALSVDASGRALVVWQDDGCGDRCSQIRGALLTNSGTTQLGPVGR
ncbi:MAG TPA: hypothetical protein VM142_13550 [Acidimicrobiales bacterium]|nr:hypothetical protein [Acidimicrobiales bacterium]